MMRESSMKLFDHTHIRSCWDEVAEEWFFSVQDVVGLLTDSVDSKQYIKKMRSRDKELDSNWGTICTPVAMTAHDGKKRKIQASSTAGLLRIIQSIPSPKAEPFKRWLAQVGKERIDEIADPELILERGVHTYRQKGYSEKWINQRLKSIEVRKDLTDEWDRSGVQEGKEYALLTDEITKAWAGLTTREYKHLKNLKKESLRDNMSNMELILTMLAEVTTTEFSRNKNPKGFEESVEIACQGGTIAGNARKEIEGNIGISIITPHNSKNPLALDNEQSPLNDDKN